MVSLSSCGASSDSDEARTTDDRPPRARGSAEMATNALGRRELPRVRRLVQSLLEGVNARDPSICTRLYTRRYREQLMDRRDPAALRRCRDAARRAEVQASLVRIERVQVRRGTDGRLRGSVRVLERIGTSGLLRVDFGVVRTPPGAYRIDSGHGTQVKAPEPRPGRQPGTPS